MRTNLETEELSTGEALLTSWLLKMSGETSLAYGDYELDDRDYYEGHIDWWDTDVEERACRQS